MNDRTHIILFDGVCNLCNGIVQFVIKRDSNAKFKFASLQSKEGKKLLHDIGLAITDFESFVYINENNFYLKSSAVLRVLKELDKIWKLSYVLIIIPAKIRDFFYDIIAQNRYKWFGKRDSCMVPTPELEERFFNRFKYKQRTKSHITSASSGKWTLWALIKMVGFVIL